MNEEKKKDEFSWIDLLFSQIYRPIKDLYSRT